MQIAVVDINNKKLRDITLAPAAEEKVNKAVLYYAIKASRNALRHGTAAVKDRSFVSMTNKKTWNQKGTGNARHGARSANIFVGGGSAHGPRPRSYVEKVNKQFKKTSYREAFKYLIQNNALTVLDKVAFAKPSTKQAFAVTQKLGLKKALVILSQEDRNAHLSFRNLRDIAVIAEHNLNVYDLFKYGNVVVTAAYFDQLKERFGL
jgi:large subunit ribosomal protein L4